MNIKWFIEEGIILKSFDKTPAKQKDEIFKDFVFFCGSEWLKS